VEVPRHWRMRKQRYQLQGEVCSNCGAKVFPPRPVCPHCGHGLVQQREISRLVMDIKQPVAVIGR